MPNITLKNKIQQTKFSHHQNAFKLNLLKNNSILKNKPHPFKYVLTL